MTLHNVFSEIFLPFRIIGSTIEEARERVKKEGYTYRVASVDGRNYILTQEVCKNRVNFHVVEGKVNSFTIG